MEEGDQARLAERETYWQNHVENERQGPLIQERNVTASGETIFFWVSEIHFIIFCLVSISHS